jgi:hypothetical protein
VAKPGVIQFISIFMVEIDKVCVIILMASLLMGTVVSLDVS